MFTRCCFQNVPIRVPFSKSTVFKICRQKMCRFRVNRRPIRHIFCRFQNVPASCERSLTVSVNIVIASLLSVAVDHQERQSWNPIVFAAIFVHFWKVRLSDVKDSFIIVHIRKFYKCIKVSFYSDSFFRKAKAQRMTFLYQTNELLAAKNNNSCFLYTGSFRKNATHFCSSFFRKW